MIGYRIKRIELIRRSESQLEGGKTGWGNDTRALTNKFQAAGKYLKDEDDIWGQVKDVFIRLQHGKCAFCERRLEARKEYDVEHFRPKGAVHRWPIPKALSAEGIVVNQPAPRTPNENGYYLLVYDLQNYCAACSKCNTILKKNYFPIRGQRNSSGNTPVSLLKKEEPFLIFPIGDFDDDPENLITFRGIVPQANSPKGSHAYHRALVTISIFKLNDINKRSVIFEGRMNIIIMMGLAFQRLKDPHITKDVKDDCEAIIDRHKSSDSEYASCGRSYAKLWHQNPAEAEKIFRETVAVMKTISFP